MDGWETGEDKYSFSVNGRTFRILFPDNRYSGRDIYSCIKNMFCIAEFLGQYADSENNKELKKFSNDLFYLYCRGINGYDSFESRIKEFIEKSRKRSNSIA